MSRPYLPRSVRQQVIRHSRKRCSFCGVLVRRHARTPAHLLTLDHVDPLARGGGNTPSNLVVACRVCNARKGSKTLREAGMRIIAQKTPRPVLYNRHQWRRDVIGEAAWI